MVDGKLAYNLVEVVSTPLLRNYGWEASRKLLSDHSGEHSLLDCTI
jgi:hypothetical protein